jgi:hypothetical protein
MKKHLSILLLLPVLLLIVGCPVSTSYPIADPGTEKIDNQLIGTWLNTVGDSLSEVLKVSIARKTKTSYNVQVLEKGNMYVVDTTLFEGYVTKLEGKTFFFLKPEGKTNEFYLYCYKFDDNVLKTYDVGLKEGGLDAVTSTEAFRKEVTASLRHSDCLSGEITWKKVK